MNTLSHLLNMLIAVGLILSAVGQAEEAPPASRQMDRLELDTSAIKGNQELPKVLYILPWKESGIGDLAGKPVNSLLDEVLAPLDREVFQRQVRYFDQLYAGSEAVTTEEEVD